MAKTKDGFYKQIGTTEGSNSYLLLAGGDYIGFSNSSGSNTVVQRDANGYIVNSYFRTTGGGSERNASGLGYIAGFNASDYYIRSYTSAAVKTWLGLGSNAYTSTAYLPLTGGTMTGNIILKGGTSADMTDANIHPRLRFDNSDSSQTVSFIYTDYDTYRAPAGIKLIGSQGNEWFEAPKLIKTGSSDSYVLLGGGGHVLLSSLSSSHNHDSKYFPLTGGRITTGSGDVYVEFWRGTNASWKVLNSSGTLHFQSNYTSVVGSYYDAMTLSYNSGNVWVKGTVTAPTFSGGRFYTGYDSGQANSMSCSNWFRSSGATGWINATYGGGVYQNDSTYVKVYGSKAFKVTSKANDSINTDGGIQASGNITTRAGFINTGYPADAVLLAGGGATTFSGLYKHCCTFSMGVGNTIDVAGLFTLSGYTFKYYNGQTIPYGRDFQAAIELKLTFSVPASLPTLNETTIKNGTYKIDITSYRTIQNGFEDRAWCIHSIGTNSVIIILAGTSYIDGAEGFIINVTKRM